MRTVMMYVVIIWFAFAWGYYTPKLIEWTSPRWPWMTYSAQMVVAWGTVAVAWFVWPLWVTALILVSTVAATVVQSPNFMRD
jgi:hypothetical protein